MSKYLKAITSSIILILGWEGLAYITPTNTFASFTAIIPELFDRQILSIFGLDILYTLSVLIPGILLGWLVSYLLHFVSLHFSQVYNQLYNIVRFIPLPAIIPLGILLFGLGWGSQLFIIIVGAWILITGFLLSAYESDYHRYEEAQKGWGSRLFSRYRNFITLSWYSSHRLWPSLIVWSIGNIILSELVIGGDFGVGIRMIESQQLFNAPRLWLYIFAASLLAIVIERLLHNASSYLVWNTLKKISVGGLVVIAVISSGFLWWRINPQSGFTITTYEATANLPLFVMVEKYNSQDYVIEQAPSGITALQALQGQKTRVSGYVDMPNILTAGNDDLRIISQTVEEPKNPILYLFTQSNSLDGLSGSVAYFPNNVLMRSGLDLALFSKGVNTNQIQYQSSNDPNSLVQAMQLDKIDGLLVPEPFATQIEESSDLERINPGESIIGGISFDQLPLAGTVIDTDALNDREEAQLVEDLDTSIDFIRKNTVDNKAQGELADILEEYNISRNSLIPAFQKHDEYNASETEVFVRALNLYDPSLNLDVKDIEGLYL